MKVYCDVVECKNCKNGMCEHRNKTGEAAIKLHMSWTGRFICTNIEEDEEDLLDKIVD